MRPLTAVHLATGAVALIVMQAAVPAFASMYDRVCPRVVSRFTNDKDMWDRVNTRIEKRFGFRCIGDNATPAQNSNSSKSVTSAILDLKKKHDQKMQDTIQTAAKVFKKSQEEFKLGQLCRVENWTCEEYGPCTNFRQTRVCRPPDISCPAGHPVYEQQCGVREALEQLRDDIIERAYSYKDQGSAAYDGLARLDALDKLIVEMLNGERVRYNFDIDPKEIKKFQDEFKSLPLIYY